MRYLLIFLFILSAPTLFAEDNEPPSLLEALQIFFEKNGGSVEDLNFKKEEGPKIEESLKALLIDLAKEQSKDSYEEKD